MTTSFFRTFAVGSGLGWLRVLAALLVLVTIVLCSSSVMAGNRDSFFLGNEAAMSGGAVTATVSDGGSLWYNPAGLGQNDRRRFNLNGSAIVLRFRDIEAAMQHDLEGVDPEETALRSLQVLSVPSASSMTFRLRKGVSLSLGSFANRLDRYRVSARVQGSVQGSTEAADLSFGREGFENVLVFGLGVGFQPQPWFRFGVSLFVVYAHEEGQAYLNLHLTDSENAPGSSAHQSLRREELLDRIGFDSVIGFQLAPVSGLRIGLCLRPPRLEFARFGSRDRLFTQSATVDGFSFSSFELEEEDQGDEDVLISRMPTFVLGLAWEAKRFRIGLEGDITPPLTLPGGGLLRRLLWNLRLGAQISLTDRVRLGLGAFTDRSDRDDPQRFHEQRFDYYGGTLGVQLENPISLAAGEKATSIVLVSTFALRYAAGIGEAGTMRLEVPSFAGLSPEASRPEFGGGQPALFHELSLHIGNAFLF